MQKIKSIKWQTLILAFLFLGACSDWGKMDSPAGNQVFPKLERVGFFNFNAIDEALEFLAYTDGDEPTLETDEDLGSVLYLNGGYVKISNPLNSVRVQNGVSLTFWIKQAEGETQDLRGAIFSFANENASQRMFFTANGWISYDGADGTYEYNNPSSVETGIITPGEWHYVALSVTDKGYFVYVDGVEKINHTETNFDCLKIVQFMASAPNFFIGYGSDTQPGEMWIDDMSIYRNQITNTQIRVPDVSGSGGETKEYINLGNEDCSTGWWTVWSDIVRMTGDQTIHFGFYNHTNGNTNWNNWVIVVTNGKFTGGGGDGGAADEYFVLRADAYGWGGSHVGANISSNYNWDTFKDDINGAWVDLTIKRTGDRIDLTAVTTTTEGTVYTMTYFCEAELGSTIGAFLTCEGAYLQIDPEEVYSGASYTSGSYLVGPTDLSAGWWQHFSEFTKITGDLSYPFVYNFINYTNGAANWNNWLLVATNGKDRGEDGYLEYFVIRSDAWRWGNNLPGGNGNISHDYNWDTFSNDMKGATCVLAITRIGGKINLNAKTTTTTGTVYTMTYFHEDVTSADIGLFLLVEGAYLDMRIVGYYPFLKMGNNN